ncbi:hypothetical protein [Niallia sp. Krafla_26]|uniref:hypothetical protein n=1 Tax=Niallia sp. Krafla_26 TaxID=3064703 RepID=UPI003D16FAFB
MNNKTCRYIVVVIFIFLGMGNHSTYANEWEDEDTPISFKIEMLPWKEVNKLLPNKTKFTIIDVETGLQFNVQRRAGSQHADVQPLTKEDTRIMKKIYHDKWSWKRRAIIVLFHDQMIAASMNGMPHGGGILKNNFPGHFCVHFSGSITHRLKQEDLAHKLMILRAAGKLEEYLHTVDPYELIHIFKVATNQDDQPLLNQIISDSTCTNCLDDLINNITSIAIGNFQEPQIKDMNGLLFIEIPARVNIYTSKNELVKKEVHFILKRDVFVDRWVIDENSLLKELE